MVSRGKVSDGTGLEKKKVRITIKNKGEKKVIEEDGREEEEGRGILRKRRKERGEKQGKKE